MFSKKIFPKDLFSTYKASYSLYIPWKEVMPADCVKWLDNFESATNCPKALVLPALISMTGTFCGPNSSVGSNGSSFTAPLNQYIFAVCDPGGGKSNVYDRVIAPVLRSVESLCQHRIGLESYTTAGIQKNQSENGGYGLITGDEGERFLCSVNNKQKQGESERALLCKMWNGKGDTSTLSYGNRGFDKTSMSACIFIQPYTFIQELIVLNCEDGLMDRFLVFSARPVFKKTEEIILNAEKLKQSKMTDFVNVFNKMYADHKDGEKKYYLSGEAQRYYNRVVDNYAAYIEDKYRSESGK